MRDIYIIGGLRSHIGSKNGIFRRISAEMLGAELLRGIVDKFGITADRVICGNGIGAGGNITRLMTLTAGFSLPSVTIDSQCASGLDAVRTAAAEIGAGFCECVICGGFESASTQPTREYSPNHPDYESRLADGGTSYMTAKFAPEVHTEDIMLRAAEHTAEVFGISRHNTDRFVLESHRRAAAARDSGMLDGLIYPMLGSVCDEGIRDRMSRRLLDRLRPVLKDGKTITAASSCLINDGAAMLVLCSGEYAAEHGLKPAARIIGFADTSAAPELSPTAAVDAVKKLTERFGRPDCIEVNEAFALIDVLMEREFGEISGYNCFGGALAYGHPYGASGAVILLHLLRALESADGRLGFAAAAAAGGIGSGIAVERV